MESEFRRFPANDWWPGPVSTTGEQGHLQRVTYNTSESLEEGNITTIINQNYSIFLPCNNPENIIDEPTAQRVQSAFDMVILPLIELFGVSTNVINCVVFARQGLKDRINLCLFTLAVSDIGFLSLMFASRLHRLMGLFDEELAEFWSKKYLNTVLAPMIGSFTVSNLMTLIISLERAICVLAPFKAKKFLRTKWMAVLIIVMAVYILGVDSLMNLKYVTVKVVHPLTNTSRWVSRFSPFYLDNRLLVDIFYNYLLNLTVPLLSLLVMLTATSLTVHTLTSTHKWRRTSVQANTSLAERRERAVTKMLTVICFIYVSTMTPSVIQAFFRTLVPGYIAGGKYCNIFWTIQTAVHSLEVINSSVNFIVYCSMGSRYRQTLRHITGTAHPSSRKP